MKDGPVLSKMSEDARGASYSIMLPNGQELLLIYTRNGFWRGGHSHNVEEVSVLLSGRATTMKRLRGRGQTETQEVHSTGAIIRNGPGEVHVTLALEDYWLVDIRPGAKASRIKSRNYRPYRRLVTESMQMVKQ
jgi:hypothetical protein